jgi:hypothetical protein
MANSKEAERRLEQLRSKKSKSDTADPASSVEAEPLGSGNHINFFEDHENVPHPDRIQ